jgi:hypothetical protein
VNDVVVICGSVPCASEYIWHNLIVLCMYCLVVGLII